MSAEPWKIKRRKITQRVWGYVLSSSSGEKLSLSHTHTFEKKIKELSQRILIGCIYYSTIPSGGLNLNQAPIWTGPSAKVRPHHTRKSKYDWPTRIILLIYQNVLLSEICVSHFYDLRFSTMLLSFPFIPELSSWMFLQCVKWLTIFFYVH